MPRNIRGSNWGRGRDRDRDRRNIKARVALLCGAGSDLVAGTTGRSTIGLPCGIAAARRNAMHCVAGDGFGFRQQPLRKSRQELRGAGHQTGGPQLRRKRDLQL